MLCGHRASTPSSQWRDVDVCQELMEMPCLQEAKSSPPHQTALAGLQQASPSHILAIRAESSAGRWPCVGQGTSTPWPQPTTCQQPAHLVFRSVGAVGPLGPTCSLCPAVTP